MLPVAMDALAFDLFLVNICDMPALLAFVVRTLPAVAPVRRRVYLTLQIIGFLLVLLLDSTGAYEFVAAAFAVMWALSLAFQEGSFRCRVVTLSLRIVACMLSLGFATAFWLVLTGNAPTSDFRVCRALLAEHALSALVAAVLFWVLLPFADRLATRLMDYPRVSENDAELEGGGDVSRAFAPFVAMQAALLFCFLSCAMLLQEPPVAYAVFMAFAIGCVLADGALLHALNRHAELQRLELLVELRERELAARTAESEWTIADIEAFSRLRHDVRNHLAAAEALARQGDVVRARALLEDLRRALIGEERR